MLNIIALRWITLGGIFLWFILYWQGGKKIVVDIQNSLRSKISRLDTLLLIVISICSTGAISASCLASFKLLPIVLSQSWTVAFIGMSLSTLGILGMFYCRHYLGKFWRAETHLSNQHQIIDTGPYRLIRHPIYTFAILMHIGLGLAFLSVWVVLFAGAASLAYIFKTKEEDLYLEQNLTGYREYKQRVRYYLLPGFW